MKSLVAVLLTAMAAVTVIAEADTSSLPSSRTRYSHGDHGEHDDDGYRGQAGRHHDHKKGHGRPGRRVQYDVVVVGGGPSGLSALSGLARVRRRVLLIDSAVYRNGKTQHMHDVLGFDGVKPAYYRWAARGQISHYKTVRMTNGTVTKIEPAGPKGDGYFKVHRSHGGKLSVVTARKVILGTGLRDQLPATPGVRENWGNGIYWCTWCDGHEHADQKLGILKSLDKSIGSVRQVLTLNRDIVIFTNGTDTPGARAALEKTSPKWLQFLKRHRVSIDNRPLRSIEKVRGGDHDGDASLPSVPSDNVFRVNFAYGRPVYRNGFLLDEDPVQASKVGEDVGVTLYGGRLASDASRGMETNIHGVYAVGDANADNSTNVPHALWSGKRAAVSAHGALAREQMEREANAYGPRRKVGRRRVEESPRAIWERMKGEAGDVLDAGEFDRF